MQLFTLENVPSDSAVTCISVAQNGGDVDLFMNWNGILGEFDCQSETTTVEETCTIGKDWHISVMKVVQDLNTGGIMRVLVTGATGYIGGRIIPHLLDQGHSVRILTRDRERALARPWGEAVEIFVDHYYKRPRIDWLPEMLRASVFDMYVNAGSNAVVLLQRMLREIKAAAQGE